jgi:hypothetical protein
LRRIASASRRPLIQEKRHDAVLREAVSQDLSNPSAPQPCRARDSGNKKNRQHRLPLVAGHGFESNGNKPVKKH